MVDCFPDFLDLDLDFEELEHLSASFSFFRNLRKDGIRISLLLGHGLSLFS
jgi:hypothetical protein